MFGLVTAGITSIHSDGRAVSFPNRSTKGVHGTMTFSGTLAASIDLDVVASADDTVAGGGNVPAAGSGTAVTLSGGSSDTVAFGNITATCEAATNGACYKIAAVTAAHYVATLTATMNFSGFGATTVGLRICRDAAGGANWPATQLRADLAGDDQDWTVDGGGTNIGDIATGSCATNGNTLIAATTTSPQTVEFQIAGRINSGDTVSPSTAVTFETF